MENLTTWHGDMVARRRALCKGWAGWGWSLRLNEHAHEVDRDGDGCRPLVAKPNTPAHSCDVEEGQADLITQINMVT